MTEMNPIAMGLTPFGDMVEENAPKKEGLESPLSPNIYDAAPDFKLTEFIEPLIGEDNWKALQYTANMQGVEPLVAIRQIIANAFLTGTFECSKLDDKGVPVPVPASEKRTGNDNSPKHVLNNQIRAIIRQANFGILSSTANGLGISNVTALQRGVAAVLNTPLLMKRIRDSELAMQSLEKTL